MIIPIVLVVVFLILVGLLRAVTAPLILIGTVVLSFGAALGISALLFEYVFGFAGSDPGFPLFAFVFLVALGIDYNIFLMTRVREETATFGTRRGSLVALSSTGGVITSAGLVLAATFLVLGSIPVVFLAEIGVAVALGVMLDTMIVRSVLVTAINLDLGGKIWWPSKLDRGDEPSATCPSAKQEEAAGPLTGCVGSPTPPYPEARGGVDCPASACCSGCGSSRDGGCASAAAGSPTRSSSGSRSPTAGTSAPTTPHVGGWSYEYEFAPADPAPLTTIGWRLVSTSSPATASTGTTRSATARSTFPDLVVPHTAESALAEWRESRVPITTWLTDATDDDLAELRPSHLPERQMSAGDQVRTLVDEQIHHGAEIALLRDLFARPHEDYHTGRRSRHRFVSGLAGLRRSAIADESVFSGRRGRPAATRRRTRSSGRGTSARSGRRPARGGGSGGPGRGTPPAAPSGPARRRRSGGSRARRPGGRPSPARGRSRRRGRRAGRGWRRAGGRGRPRPS